MTTISIAVDSQTAEAFVQASPEEKRKLELLLALRLRELTSTEPRSLQAIMDEIGARGAAEGITLQQVESMLNDE